MTGNMWQFDGPNSRKKAGQEGSKPMEYAKKKQCEISYSAYRVITIVLSISTQFHK